MLQIVTETVLIRILSRCMHSVFLVGRMCGVRTGSVGRVHEVWGGTRSVGTYKKFGERT